jgi:hypothetical protein
MPRQKLSDDEKAKRAQERVERAKDEAFAHFENLVPTKKARVQEGKNSRSQIQDGPSRTYGGLSIKATPQLRSTRAGRYMIDELKLYPDQYT